MLSTISRLIKSADTSPRHSVRAEKKRAISVIGVSGNRAVIARQEMQLEE
jgi:hypothetical protein